MFYTIFVLPYLWNLPLSFNVFWLINLAILTLLFSFFFPSMLLHLFIVREIIMVYIHLWNVLQIIVYIYNLYFVCMDNSDSNLIYYQSF